MSINHVSQSVSLNVDTIEAGTVNEEAREIVSELREVLSYQTPSIAQLLEQPARTVSPLIPPPQFPLGPEPVSNETRH